MPDPELFVNRVFFPGPQIRHPTAFWPSEFLMSNRLFVSLKTIRTPRPFSLPGFKSLPFFGFSNENLPILRVDLRVNPDLKLTELLEMQIHVLHPIWDVLNHHRFLSPLCSFPLFSLWGCSTVDADGAPCSPILLISHSLLSAPVMSRPVSKFAEFSFCSHLLLGPLVTVLPSQHFSAPELASGYFW